MSNKMSLQSVLFDLDGTIIEPRQGIVNSILYAVGQYGLKEEHPETLDSFIGPPLHHSFQQRYHLTEEQSFEMVKLYRVYYSKKGIYECTLYPGIRELIEQLYERNIFLALATSKPEDFANQLLEHFKLNGFFEFTAAALYDGKRTEKNEVIEYALENIPPFEHNEILMLGDREFDIDGGKYHGIKTAWARWGYGHDEVVLLSKPDLVLNNPLELLDFIL